jgi:hypothetical protein
MSASSLPGELGAQQRCLPKQEFMEMPVAKVT